MNSLTSLHIYENTLDTTYALVKTIDTGDTVDGLFATSDGSYVIVGQTSGSFKIYDRNSNYSLFQSIDDSIDRITSISMTKDLKTLAVGGYDQKFRIYAFNGTSFNFKE